jgi:ABC-type dipeptide/oligopeptide/nickel transport system ATPase component
VTQSVTHYLQIAGMIKMPTKKEFLREIQGLTVVFNEGQSVTHSALNEVDLSISEGEILGLVGESGSGKTVLSLSILGLLPANGRISSGSIRFQGRSVMGLSEKELQGIRGKKIAMIFQDPQASLNPVYTVGRQIEWVLKLHRGITGVEAETEVLRLFESVKLRDPLRCAKAYPRELSGGMCQRVMIAMALAGQPKLLIADEPTSALDVSVAAEIVSLLASLRETFGLSILIITHDLSVATCLADRIAVLDQSRLVEQIASDRFLSSAQHEASRKLIDASRFLGAALQRVGGDHLTEYHQVV